MNLIAHKAQEAGLPPSPHGLRTDAQTHMANFIPPTTDAKGIICLFGALLTPWVNLC